MRPLAWGAAILLLAWSAGFALHAVGGAQVARAAEAWPTVTATLVERASVTPGPPLLPGFRRLYVAYAYEVGGVRYQNDRVWSDGALAPTALAQRRARDLHAAPTASVRYDPEHPGTSLLFPEAHGPLAASSPLAWGAIALPLLLAAVLIRSARRSGDR